MNDPTEAEKAAREAAREINECDHGQCGPDCVCLVCEDAALILRHMQPVIDAARADADHEAQEKYLNSAYLDSVRAEARAEGRRERDWEVKGNLAEMVDVLQDEKRELEAEVARLREENDAWSKRCEKAERELAEIGVRGSPPPGGSYIQRLLADRDRLRAALGLCQHGNTIPDPDCGCGT